MLDQRLASFMSDVITRLDEKTDNTTLSNILLDKLNRKEFENVVSGISQFKDKFQLMNQMFEDIHTKSSEATIKMQHELNQFDSLKTDKR